MANKMLGIISGPPRYDLVYGGNYQITGTVDKLGVVGKYWVWLFDLKSGICIRKTCSDSNGIYKFTYITYLPYGYFILAFDRGINPGTPVNPVNAAISDLITPELMP